MTLPGLYFLLIIPLCFILGCKDAELSDEQKESVRQARINKAKHSIASLQEAIDVSHNKEKELTND